MNDITTRATGTAVATYQERWEQDAQRAKEAEPLQGGTWLKAKGGQLTYGEEILPGAQAALIVLDSFAENTFYRGRFDADNPMPPICYALGRDGEAMFPHLDGMKQDMTYFMPQHFVNGQPAGCDGCPMNEWGSAEEGRGKACQNRRRLVVIPAGYYQPRPGSRDFDLHLFEDPKHFQTVEAASFKLSVTSVKNWANYVHQLAAVHRRPPHGVVTRMAIVPHQKHQHEVIFEPIEMVPDSLAEVVISRHDAMKSLPFQPYLAPTPQERQGNVRGGFRGGAR